MAFQIKLTITGLQEAQARNLRRIAALRPTGATGAAIRDVTLTLHRYAVAITHVDTGTLRAGHRIRIHGLEGEIYIAGNARNPRTGRLAANYGRWEHRRGGTHAFYDRTRAEAGPAAMKRAMNRIRIAITGA